LHPREQDPRNGADPHGDAVVDWRTARTCYDHLAGRVAVSLARALERRQLLSPAGESYTLTSSGGLVVSAGAGNRNGCTGAGATRSGAPMYRLDRTASAHRWRPRCRATERVVGTRLGLPDTQGENTAGHTVGRAGARAPLWSGPERTSSTGLSRRDR